MAFSPVYVLVTAELVGGDEVEDSTAPRSSGTGTTAAKSVHESDCAPSSPAALERRFTAQHAFRRAGDYNIKVTHAARQPLGRRGLRAVTVRRAPATSATR